MTTPLYDVSTREGFLRRAVETTDRRIPPRFHGALASHPDVTAWCDALAQTSPGGGSEPPASLTVVPAMAAASSSLLILGPTGTGKTYQAYGALRTLAAKGVTVGWYADTVAGMLASLRPREGIDSEAEYRKVAAVPLLLLDDLGAAKGSEWTEEILYRLINDRYVAMLPGLFTSNVPVAELRAALGDRVSSRLVEMCQRIILRGADRRRSAE